MSILELYQKFLNSGFHGNPEISDKELVELQEKLEEFEEFVRAVNIASSFFSSKADQIKSIIWWRKNS